MIFNIAIMLFVVWICIYSFSFGVWTWQNKNKFGAFMVMFFSLIAVLLPCYILFVL